MQQTVVNVVITFVGKNPLLTQNISTSRQSERTFHSNRFFMRYN